MPPPPLTVLDFASVCDAVYDVTVATVAGFTRFNDTRRWSGFQGAIYRRANGTGLDHLVAFAGTQPGEGGGVDIVADAGFGGPGAGLAAGLLLGPLGSLLSSGGQALLSHQCGCAEELLDLARSTAGARDRIFLTGHSLGGGIAQIVAARRGIPAVGISAPAVTAVPGVSAAWSRNHVPIVCLRVRNDPINHTGRIGAWLGRIIFLDSARNGGAAHSIAETRAELSPQGSFSQLGARDPFAT
jgi:hypothetical protein